MTAYSPLFKQIRVKSRLIISEPPNTLWRIINVKILVSPDSPVTAPSTNHHTNCIKIATGVDVKIVKNIPNDVTIIAVGNSHHIIYLKKANRSIAIPVSAEYLINGIKDSKLKRTTGNITAVSKAKNRIEINLAVPVGLQSINSFIQFLLSFNQKITVTKTGNSPNALVI